MISLKAIAFVSATLVISLVYGKVVRLPNDVKPIRYNLTFEPFLRDTDVWYPMYYNGSVTIELQIIENTKSITLHRYRLIDVSNSLITIVNSKGEETKVKETTFDISYESYTIHLETELLKGEGYTLSILHFKGELGGRGAGFFKAFYSPSGGQMRGLAATHFEPTGARKAFPCFDEPSFKATFIINLIRTANYTSVSNEALDKTIDLGDGRFQDVFKETPKMSTFTVAFAVTDFKYTEKLERHRILARPDAINNDDWKFALDISNKTLIALEDYMGIDFVIDKMDQIAIPDGYFHEHAMENWGLVVYGEQHLIRTNKSSASDYKRTACYIAHEFAHQWFGNLVTPAWWEYLWIAESFAAYFQYHIADIVQPSWRLKEQFLIDMVQVSLLREETRGAFPLDAVIESSGQYPPFHIMYEKGSSIIRMMEHVLTHDVFKNGLQIYMQKNKFSNALPKDLYAAIQEAVDKAGVQKLLNNMTVAEIMNSWENNKGYPVITVTRDYKTGGVTLEQAARFAADDNSTIYKWTVPINYVFSAKDKPDFEKTTADYWLTEEKATINNDFPTDGWLIVNKQETGYYRVNYDLENWYRIIDHLKSDNFKSIGVLNRAQLVDDSFSLANAGLLPWDVPLTLAEYAVRERDYIALSPLYYALSNTVSIFDYYNDGPREPKSFKIFGNYTLQNDITGGNRTEYNVYRDYVKTILGGVKEGFGFDAKPDDTHVDQLHRISFKDFYYYFHDN